MIDSMAQVRTYPTRVPDLSWLSQVAETRHPLSELRPIWVRHAKLVPAPAPIAPERHPYCEIGVELEGAGILFSEAEEAVRRPGDIFLAGPGVPHCQRITRFPVEIITVYFLPTVLIELGPESDGPLLLRRLTAHQSISDRLFRPPASLRRKFEKLFLEIAREFEGMRLGREIRLRTLLMELLVLLLRHEEAAGRVIGYRDKDIDWRPIHKTLSYLAVHYAEEVYARDVARAAGLSESRLKILFKQAFGMSWVKYLQGYRVHRAAALLSQPGYNVTEAALSVGFESLSHFNMVFNSFMGMAPKTYAHQTALRESDAASRRS